MYINEEGKFGHKMPPVIVCMYILLQIPVSGYGGVGKLVVEGASIADMNRYCLDMGDISLGQETGEKIIVRNVGSRPVFVKLVAYTGLLDKMEFINPINLTLGNK
jgi:hypothetical protein